MSMTRCCGIHPDGRREKEANGGLMKALATRRFFMSSAAAIPLLRGVGVWTGPDSFAIFSHGPKPWTIINLRDLSLFPLSAEINAEIGTVLAGRNVADLDPRVDGL